MTELSVIICTHNPRPQYLRRVLEALRGQTLPKSQWELLLVDNASARPLSVEWDLSWHPGARQILESELGVLYARRRGIRESKADIVVFVDDDNVLDLGYLAEVVRIGREWPQLGVWGSGKTLAEFETEPPQYLSSIVPWLALRDSDKPHWGNIFPCKEATPWGAGLCMRARVAAAYYDLLNRSPLQISSRRGGKILMSGEDIEMAYVACSMSMGMATFPELRMAHLIPRERIADDYLFRIVEGTLTSDYLLAYKWQGILPADPPKILDMLGLLANILIRRGTERRVYLAKRRAARTARQIIKAAPGGLGKWRPPVTSS